MINFHERGKLTFLTSKTYPLIALQAKYSRKDSINERVSESEPPQRADLFAAETEDEVA